MKPIYVLIKHNGNWQEISNWLDDNSDQFDTEFNWPCSESDYDQGLETISVKFVKPQDATAFKLRWG